MKKKIDKGFCLSYWRLSYRRRFIRGFWWLPVCVLFLVAYPRDGLSVGSVHISAIGFALVFCPLWLAQLIYDYIQWRRHPEPMPDQGEEERPQGGVESGRKKSRLQRHGLLWVTGFCAPAIAGAILVLIAAAFPPDWPKAVLGPMDRFMIGLFWTGAWSILAGRLLLLVGFFLGIWLISIDGIRSRRSLLSVLVMALGLAAGIYGWIFSQGLRELGKHIS